ncbi:hypothetical protein [Cardinium endosymbiont of Sogatella furcifera]|uniref:hypothetical protein n=1 Tax=Cardinium endosymbiont of Sogatella furcifera TaxID=650378 RepID=UPI000E0DF360|nr:hypothetical protein [Cardinium endosymbiont of Sogatella furcifera]
MKKTTIYHLPIMWAYIMATLAGCSYHSKNHTISSPCSTQEERLACSSNPHLCKFNDAREFDTFLEGVYSLLDTLKECCRKIDAYQSNYTVDNITKMDNALRQHRGDQPQHDLMVCNPERCIHDPSIALDTIIASQKKQVKDLSRLLCYNQSIQSETMRPHKYFIQRFSSKSSTYLTNKFIPCWGKLVEGFLCHALQTSVTQGTMGLQEANRTYQNAYEALQDVYSPENMKDDISFSDTEMEQNRQYSPLELIKKIEIYKLKPIKKMYAKLSILMRKITYNSDTLRAQVIGSLTTFYHIAYGFGITDLIAILGAKDIEILDIKLSLADFIAGNLTNFDQINKKIKQLTTHCAITLLEPEETEPLKFDL